MLQQDWHFCLGLVDIALHKFLRTLQFSAKDGTTQATVCSVIVQLSIFLFNVSVVICLHTWLDWLIPTGRLWQMSPQKRCLSLSGQRLECICVLEHTIHPVSTMWSHPASSLLTDTSALCSRNLNPPTNLNTAVAVFFYFYFLIFACMLYRLMMQNHPPLLFFLLIIQYCNIFNIK